MTVRDAFDRLTAASDPAMVVVTTAAEGERAGCLVGFHSQRSIDPPGYAVWLSKANHTYRVALLATHVAVHFLDRADLDLAELFGTTTGDDIDKFGRCAWSAGPEGVPLLDRCPNRAVLHRVAMVDADGDHACLFAEPVTAEAQGSLDPLRLSAVSHLQAAH